jgi:signal peptidase I
MTPTLRVGQTVTADRASATQPLTVGEIVIFHPPHGADEGNGTCGDPTTGINHSRPCDRATPGVSPQTFIKRIVAGPGDRISILDGRVTRNGVRESAPYAADCPDAVDCDFPTAITVPAGQYYVLGDNRAASDDSRFWGPVARSSIIAIVHTH